MTDRVSQILNLYQALSWTALAFLAGYLIMYWSGNFWLSNIFMSILLLNGTLNSVLFLRLFLSQRFNASSFRIATGLNWGVLTAFCFTFISAYLT